MRSRAKADTGTVWLKRGALAAGAYLAYRSLRFKEQSFQDKVVLITGGSKGLGMLLARDFAREGAKVAIVARYADEVERALAWLATEGAENVFGLTCDVADRQQVQLAVDRVLAHFGTIDILVNNAGTISVAPVDSVSLEDFEEAHAVMFWGQIYTTFALLPLFQRKRSGQVVNITSIGGLISVPHLVPYSTAKFAALGLSQGLGAELRRYGIRVTTIVPGLMRTGSHINAQFKGAREYTWFATLASLPGLSLAAEKASQQTLAAVRRGKAFQILGAPAKIGATLYSLFPNFSTGALALVNRLLPSPAEAPEKTSGALLRERQPQLLVDFVNKDVAQYQTPSRENHPDTARAAQDGGMGVQTF